MKKITFFLVVFTVLTSWNSKAQTTLFSEDFESATATPGQELSTPHIGWTNHQMSPSHNNNKWWILNTTGSECPQISGNYSMGVSKGTLATSANAPVYFDNTGALSHHVAYYTTLIDATAYENILLDFNWIAGGEVNDDFGSVCWSTNGTTWIDFSYAGNAYTGNGSINTETNLDISEVDGTQFYIGFRWQNDGNADPSNQSQSFIVDDIVIKGTPTTPPTNNDDCIGAINLTPSPNSNCSGYTYTDTTVGATNSGIASSCGGNPDDDVWFSFEATSTYHTITAEQTNTYANGGIRRIMLEVFEGSGCSGLTSIACIDSGSGNGVPAISSLNSYSPGDTYYVRVFSRSLNTDEGEFNICVTSPPVPNDTCAGATNVPVNPGESCDIVVSDTTVGATDSGYPTNCSYVGTIQDQWFSFVATNTSHIVTVEPDGNPDLTGGKFEVYSGSCGSLTFIGCTDNEGPGNTSPEIQQLSNLAVGETYYVRVYIHRNDVSSYQGNFNICITTPPLAPANDECSGAVNLTVNPTDVCAVSTSGTTVGGTESLSAINPCDISTDDDANDDVWYSFVATSNFHDLTVTHGTLYDAVIDLREGSCGTTTHLDCENHYFSSTTEVLQAGGLTIGQTYYVRVYGAEPDGQGTFDICVTTPCNPGDGNALTTNGSLPEVITGESGQGDNDPSPIGCGSSGCVDLEADFTPLGSTNDYTVESITYDLPYQMDCLENHVNLDDSNDFSQVIDLPFEICFYGESYDQMIIGANGVVSFSRLDLAGTFMGFNVVNPIPHPTRNSHELNIANDIFYGACIMAPFTDFDGEENGAIGWEEITFALGERALVIGYTDFSPYSSPSNFSNKLNSMIVIYETTNVIDIYIKDKTLGSGSIHSNFNKAIIGLQDETGTEATVPPGRNQDDTIWTATNEAWRFTPSGTDVTTSITWYEDGIHNPAYDDMAIINVCPTATTVYTSEITYDLCGTDYIISDDTTLIKANTKIWDDSESTDWHTAGNWSDNAVPTIDDCVIIPITPNNPIISSNNDGFGLNLTIEDSASLEIQSNATVTIYDFVDVQGNAIFNLNSSGSLIQVNDNAINTGIIYSQRAPKSTYNPVLNLEYVYWSSPVKNFPVSNVSPGTSSTLIFEWIPTINGNGNGDHGDWDYATGNMASGKGYAIRGLSNTPTTIPGSGFQ